MGVRHYTLQLTTVGPVHIGSGRKLGKKDYYYPDEKGKEIAVLDAEKFVGGLSQISQNQLDAYVRFLETNSNKSLKDFLEDYPDLEPLAQESILYRVSTNFGQKKERGKEEKQKYFDVDECMKDICGCPYVPGSSIKGMLRTALLSYFLAKDNSRFASLYRLPPEQKDYKRAGEPIEKEAFWLERPDKDDPEVVNDIMRYISVSDSAPLSTDDLVFAQKYDKFSKNDNGSHKTSSLGRRVGREGNELNVYRESIKPNTKLEFSLVVDDRIDKYFSDSLGILDANGLRTVFEHFNTLYEERFLSSFDLGVEKGGQRGSRTDEKPRCQFMIPFDFPDGVRHVQCKLPPAKGSIYCEKHRDQIGKGGVAIPCYLGGGVGFPSKTVLNALFPDETTRVMHTAKTLYAQFPTKIDRNRHQGLWDKVDRAGFKPKSMKARYKKAKDDHRHWKDPELGASPHTVKFAIVEGKRYPMGKCMLEIKEEQ